MAEKKSHKRTWSDPTSYTVNDRKKIEDALNDIRELAQNGTFKKPLLSHSSFLPYLNVYYKVHTSKTYIATNFADVLNECIELYDDYIQNSMPPEVLFNLWRTRYQARNSMNLLHLNNELEKLKSQAATQTEIRVVFDEIPMKRVK